MPVRDLERLAERLPQNVHCGAPDGTLLYINQWWSDYTGMSMNEALGWGWASAVHPLHFERTLQPWLRAVEAAQPYDFITKLKRKADGSFRWHVASGVPLLDAAGRTAGWIGTSVDVHDAYEARQVQALHGLVTSDAFKAGLDELCIAYHEVLAYQRDNVVGRHPDGEPVSDAPALSLVELQVLRLMAHGLSNREIGRRMSFAYGTIKAYVRSILDKLGARDRTAAAVRAVRLGLI